MAASISTLLFALIITAVSISEKPLIVSVEGKRQVPCVFFFGDSQFDNGNNNPLLTTAKVNYPPYGIDYPNGLPTGRFANGGNVPDYLAEFLGFRDPVPPFVTAIPHSISKGVNYASGLAGILDQTGQMGGDRYPMNEQLRNHERIIDRIAKMQGRPIESVKRDYMGRCLYVVNIGSNDYLNNYLVPAYGTDQRFTPEGYAEFLVQKFVAQLRMLHNLGARKVAVFGLGNLGCVPQLLVTFGNEVNASGCVDRVNSYVKPYNDRLKREIDNLTSVLSGSLFTFINATSISGPDPELISIRVVNASCCRVVPPTGLCIPFSVPCSNRNEYAFWDNYHTSSLLNRVAARRSYNASIPTDASPVDIRRLIQEQTGP